ncbi:MAG: hypothetical protein HC933_03935 [Pleurocapsa sp. SU_196_0]|nr:hypothetical protein [Pleurocapsa sp. SU_196_0]
MVATIPPNNQIYSLGRVSNGVHVYGLNGATTYSLTLIGVNAWVNVPINQGGTNGPYQPAAGGRHCTCRTADPVRSRCCTEPPTH